MPRKDAPEANSIVTSVFEDFLERLATEHAVDTSVIERLRQTLLETGGSSADKLRKALFAEDVYR